MSNYLRVMMLGTAATVFGVVATAQTPHVMATLNETNWGPAPAALPPGAQLAVLSGDPTKAAPYAVRLKFPANYAIPAHSHPANENVVVISGELFMGMGTKLDKDSATGLGPGSYALMPAGMNHYAFTKTETTIALFGMGPVGFTYVNPADDPRQSN
jgi:quercetin dioxygenase-like cupin family protein